MRYVRCDAVFRGEIDWTAPSASVNHAVVPQILLWGFWAIAYAVAFFVSAMHSRTKTCGYSFRLHPARATLTPYTATPRSTTNSASSSFCTRSVCPICLEGEATLAHLQRVRHSAPSLDVSFFCARIPYGLAIRRVIVIGNRTRRAHVRMAPGAGCRLRTKDESNMADNREMWQSLGMDLETHDQLCAVRSPASSMPRKLKTAFPFLAKIACS